MGEGLCWEGRGLGGRGVRKMRVGRIEKKKWKRIMFLP